nr:Glycoside hydrolase domain containing protein [Haemonchus contortus]
MLVEQAHPSYTPQEVLKAATEEYEESAKEFILETLKKARDLRPYALWGMYGFPYCNYDAGEKDDDYECSKTYQQWNDE